MNGSVPIGVSIHRAEAGNSVLQDCSSGSEQREVHLGHFSVALPDACVASIEGHPDDDLWVEISVDGFTLTPRTKLGAVPYAISSRFAVDAEHATSADTATSAATATAANSAAGSLDTRIAAIEGRVTAVETDVGDVLTELGGPNGDYSVAAWYCGEAGPTTGDIANEWTGVKALCEAACGTDTAHMCSLEELVRSVSVGNVVASGWFLGAQMTEGTSFPLLTNQSCVGWSSASMTQLGHVWQSPQGHPATSRCDTANAILCCD